MEKKELKKSGAQQQAEIYPPPIKGVSKFNNVKSYEKVLQPAFCDILYRLSYLRGI